MTSSNMKVLCVEDDEDTTLMLTVLLGHSHIEVRTARTMAAALRLIEEGHFDLFLLDGHCGGDSGVELCRRIRESDQHTPILFYSGDASESGRRRAVEAGAQGYLVKPNISSIIPTIIRLVAASRSYALA